MREIFKNDKGGKIVFSVLFALVIIISASNLLIPEASLFHISTSTVMLIGRYLAFALLALSLDLLWGYLGVLSLGHGAFFALGGYAFGMYLMRQIGDRGVYGDPVLPDFMVFMSYKELPWFWHGFDNPAFAIVMVLLIPSLLAFVFGFFAFKSKVTGVYLSIITQALTFALLQIFLLNDMGLGGSNGLTDFKDIFGFNLQSPYTRITLLIVSFLALFGGYAICRAIINSKFGRIVISIRDSERRVGFLGYKIVHYKLFIFVISALLAGIAGALYVPQIGIINPDTFKPVFSIELVIWVAIGGRGTLYGAIIGAFAVSYANTYFTSALAEYWLYVLGAMFILVTLLLPKGIAGLFVKMSTLRLKVPFGAKK
ncbi:MAG: urea ABC transporter permease subunit UrtC [Campylobacteraceae bacterium]|jgi:urea transport system permease protein|nr:urea ABC transporter permease subunit UrtC [Campylobacteraceae bacterium]